MSDAVLSFTIPVVQDLRGDTSSLSSVRRVLSAPTISSMGSIFLELSACISSNFLRGENRDVFADAAVDEGERGVFPILFDVFFVQCHGLL